MSRSLCVSRPLPGAQQPVFGREERDAACTLQLAVRLRPHSDSCIHHLVSISSCHLEMLRNSETLGRDCCFSIRSGVSLQHAFNHKSAQPEDIYDVDSFIYFISLL